MYTEKHKITRYRLLSTPRSFLFNAGDKGPVYGIRLGFKNITGNRAADDCAGQSHYFVNVTDVCARRVMFSFINREPGTCSITDIYFNDEDIFSVSVHIVTDAEAAENPSNTRFTPVGSHHYVPRPFHDSTTFQVAWGYQNGTDSDASHDGINQDESLGIVFDLQAGVTFADIICALNRGKFNIGLKVEESVHGASSVFINEPDLALSPALYPQEIRETKSAGQVAG